MIEKQKQVHIIQPTIGDRAKEIIRVAAYCRVSTDSEDQANSFIAQVQYYTDYIKSNSQMKLVDIYADDGITGTSIEKREDFKRMIKDCKAGKIDRILVKSISRFARNSLECLETIRLLNTLNVIVVFENDGIDTRKLNSELFVYIKSAFAQSEALAGSKRVSTAIRMKMESGEFKISTAPYGYKIENNTLIPMQTENISIKEQLKAVIHDKYWVIIILYFFIYTIGVNLKNIALIYYCNYVLGTYNDGITQTLVSVIGGVPMGIGIFAVWPLAKKFGKKNVTMWGFVLYAIGGAVCLIAPTNMVVVLIGQFIKNIGGLPCAYVFMALFADVLDHIEWKHRFRCDGLSTSIYTIILTVCAGLANGIFNLCIAKTGYIAPEYIEATKETVAAVQNAATQNVFTFFFVGLEIFTGLILAFMLRFLNVEKNIQKEQDEIKARKEEQV